MRTHFAVTPPFDTTPVSACGRGRRLDFNAFHIDCGNCTKSDPFILALDEAKSAKHALFMAQEPRLMREPWHTEVVYIICKECGHNLFRMGDRTCYGHYQDYVCGRCGNKESRLTETGMSF